MTDWDKLTALPPDQFTAAMTERLDDMREQLQANIASDQDHTDWFKKLVIGHRHAKAAFGEMSFDEYQSLATQLARRGKRSAPKKSESDHLDNLQTVAALEYIMLQRIMARLRGDSKARAPVSALDIILSIHKVDEEALRNHLNRGKARRPEIGILKKRLPPRL